MAEIRPDPPAVDVQRSDLVDKLKRAITQHLGIGLMLWMT